MQLAQAMALELCGSGLVRLARRPYVLLRVKYLSLYPARLRSGRLSQLVGFLRRHCLNFHGAGAELSHRDDLSTSISTA